MAGLLCTLKRALGIGKREAKKFEPKFLKKKSRKRRHHPKRKKH